MTVAAAVTTFNRLGSLKRCIDAIRAQEHPVDEIVVVNDQSTDGTREWLDSQADLIAVHQPGNFGCACSFHTVLRTVYERGHDFAWAMDDDVFPQPEFARNPAGQRRASEAAGGQARRPHGLSGALGPGRHDLAAVPAAEHDRAGAPLSLPQPRGRHRARSG